MTTDRRGQLQSGGSAVPLKRWPLSGRAVRLANVAEVDIKGDLHDYLQGARETLVWKLDGLREVDIRRPLTPTGTNLLGLVKHSTTSFVRYFGDVFSQPHEITLAWQTLDAEPNAEFWATPEESRDELLALYRHSWDLADTTITELPLDSTGHVPWWGDTEVTLHHVLVHLTAETQRHAGHADIVRELIDGTAGLLPQFDNLHLPDLASRKDFHDRVDDAARLAD